MVSSSKNSKTVSRKLSDQDQIEWFYQKGKHQVVGPLTPDQLLAATVDGHVKSNTLVRRGSEAWQAAVEVKGLFKWYYKGWLKQVGPLTTAQLRTEAERGIVKSDTQVRSGDEPWQTASDVKGLFDWYYKGRFKEVGPLLKSKFRQAAREGNIKPDTLVRQKDDSWKPASELQGLFEWYYQNKGKTVGPLLAAIFFKAAIEGKIKPNTLIRKGNGQWQTASEIEGFFTKVQQARSAKLTRAIITPALKVLFSLAAGYEGDAFHFDNDPNFSFDNDPGFSSDFDFDASFGSDGNVNFDSSSGSSSN